MKPVLMLNFARSGGTLMARILATEPNVILVSEVNPLGGVAPNFEMVSPELAIKQQLGQWFGIHLTGSSFKQCVAELLEHCNSTNNQLIIRDWSFLDFFPNEINNYSPEYHFNIIEHLADIAEFEKFALVRNAIDVYLSMGGNLKKFAENYLRYVESLIENSIFIIKYEDLVENPYLVLNDLCGHTGFAFKGDISTYNNVNNVTGDIHKGNASRGIRAHSIQMMPRKWVSPKVRKQINSSSDVRRANHLLGYMSSYENGNEESFIAMAKRQFDDVLARVKKRQV